MGLKRLKAAFLFVLLFVVIGLCAWRSSAEEETEEPPEPEELTFPTYQELKTEASDPRRLSLFLKDLDKKTLLAVTRLARKFPEDTRINYAAAEILSRGDVRTSEGEVIEGMPAAVACYKRAIAKEPGKPEYRFRLAQTYLETSEPRRDEASGLLKQLKQDDSANAVHNYYLAYLYFQEGKEQAALAEIEEASAKFYLDTYDVDAFRSRVGILERIGYSPALARVHSLFGMRLSAFAVIRELTEKLLRIGKNYDEKKEIEKAIAIYQKIVTMGKQIKVRSKYLMVDLLSETTRMRGLRAQLDCYRKYNLNDRAALVEDEIKLLEAREELFRGILDGMPSGLPVVRGGTEEEVSRHFDQIVAKGELAVLAEQQQRSQKLARAIYREKFSGDTLKILNPAVMKIKKNDDGTKTVTFTGVLKVKFFPEEIVSTIEADTTLVIDRNGLATVK